MGDVYGRFTWVGLCTGTFELVGNKKEKNGNRTQQVGERVVCVYVVL